MNFSVRTRGRLWSTKNLSSYTILRYPLEILAQDHLGENYRIKFLLFFLEICEKKIKKWKNQIFQNLILQFLPPRSKGLVTKFLVDISKFLEEDMFLVLESWPPSRKEKFTFESHFISYLVIITRLYHIVYFSVYLVSFTYIHSKTMTWTGSSSNTIINIIIHRVTCVKNHNVSEIVVWRVFWAFLMRYITVTEIRENPMRAQKFRISAYRGIPRSLIMLETSFGPDWKASKRSIIPCIIHFNLPTYLNQSITNIFKREYSYYET